jgi:iron complex outermembrane receptor protein
MTKMAWLRSVAIAGMTFCAASAASAASAEADQASSQNLANANASQSGAASSQEEPIQEIIVTGSRISRKDYSSNSPILTVPESVLELTPTGNLADALNELPQVTANTGPGFGPQNINLRGLGSVRSLVLLDGHRLVPEDAEGRVDLSILPPAIINNIELLTGGESAVYGADAVAGVVNFHLKTNLQGLTVSAEGGETQLGDSGIRNFSATWGNKSDRGSTIVSFSYTQRDPSVNGSRTFFDGPNGLSAGFYGINGAILQQSPNSISPTAIPPSAAATIALFQSYGVTNPAQLASLNSSNFMAFNTNGTMVQASPPVNFQDNGMVLPSKYPGCNAVAGIAQGTITTFDGHCVQLQAASTRYSTFAHSDYALTDHITVYGDFLYTNYTERANGATSGSGGGQGAQVPVTNPFVPAALRTWLSSTGVPNPVFSFAQSGTVGPTTFNNSLPVFQITGGFRGTLPIRDWTYDVYASIGQTNLQYREGNLEDYTREEQLLNAPDGGKSICAGGFNIFATNLISQACKNYASTSILDQTELEQKTFEGTVQGGIVDLPAGQLRFAAGADYRYNSLSYQPDGQVIAQPNGLIDATEAVAGLPTSGHVEVKEVYAETLIPLLKGIPFIQELSIDPAVRYSDYNLSGGATTYKIDANWKTSDLLRIRTSYQHAIRAPSPSDLFSGISAQVQSFGYASQGGGDPCDITGAARKGPNAAAIRQLCIQTGVPASLVNSYTYSLPASLGFTGGNPDLLPEIAKTYTYGFVLNPRFDGPLTQNLQLSVDRYNIDISGAIGTLSGSNVFDNCYNLTGANPTYNPDSSWCKLITRYANGVIDTITVTTSNLSEFQTSGVDTQFDWSFPLDAVGLPARLGTFAFNAIVNYTDKYGIQTTSSSPVLQYAGTIGNQQVELNAISHPKVKANYTFTWSVSDLQFALRGRFIGAMSNSNNVGIVGGTQPGIASQSLFDFFAKWRISDSVDAKFVVNNLFDTYPPNWTGNAVTDPATYDVLGRRFYMGVTAKF